MKNKGFTLIELLVVISIIGILASVVLVSVNSARNNTDDGAIKANLKTLQTEAEIYGNDNGGFGSQASTTVVSGSSCGSSGMFADPIIARATLATSNRAGTVFLSTYGINSSVACGSGPGYYMVTAVSKINPANVWCVDSNGFAGYVPLSTVNTAQNFTTCSK